MGAEVSSPQDDDVEHDAAAQDDDAMTPAEGTPRPERRRVEVLEAADDDDDDEEHSASEEAPVPSSRRRRQATRDKDHSPHPKSAQSRRCDQAPTVPLSSKRKKKSAAASAKKKDSARHPSSSSSTVPDGETAPPAARCKACGRVVSPSTVEAFEAHSLTCRANPEAFAHAAATNARDPSSLVDRAVELRGGLAGVVVGARRVSRFSSLLSRRGLVVSSAWCYEHDVRFDSGRVETVALACHESDSKQAFRFLDEAEAAELQALRERRLEAEVRETRRHARELAAADRAREADAIEVRRALEESTLCAVCLDRPKDTALAPCGHRTCEVCARKCGVLLLPERTAPDDDAVGDGVVSSARGSQRRARLRQERARAAAREDAPQPRPRSRGPPHHRTGSLGLCPVCRQEVTQTLRVYN